MSASQSWIVAVVDLDQVAQRLDPFDVLVTELQLRQPLPAARPDRSEPRSHAFLAQHCMHLGLQPGPQRDHFAR